MTTRMAREHADRVQVLTDGRWMNLRLLCRHRDARGAYMGEVSRVVYGLPSHYRYCTELSSELFTYDEEG